MIHVNLLRTAGICVLFSAMAVLAAVSSAEHPITEVVRVGMTVSDLDRATAFYTGVLTFEKVSEAEYAGEDLEQLHGVFGLRIRTARLRLGDEEIEITQYLAPEGRPIPEDSRSNDRWFQHIAIIVGDMDEAYRVLRGHNVRHVSAGPQTLPDWNPNAGGIRAFYFKDPDSHVLEILQFPNGKGHPKWHAPNGRLFLGIDHTAIVVKDTEASLALYRDQLGFTVAGASENYGEEQDRLNNVVGARLRITSLRAGSGPSVEFLEYLAPTDGRPFLADSRANDLWHWQVTLATPDAAKLLGRFPDSILRRVSPGIVSIDAPEWGWSKGAMIRDPDGHALQIFQYR